MTKFDKILWLMFTLLDKNNYLEILEQRKIKNETINKGTLPLH